MRILIADDHALFRGGLRLQLADFDRDLEAIEAESFDGLLAMAEDVNPDMVIADLGMPGMPWRQALEKLREKLPNCRIVVLSANDDDLSVREAIRIGANGFISKRDPPEVVMAALNLVHSGGTCIPPGFVKRAGQADAPAPLQGNVTHRQRQVLQLLARGLSNKQIAYELQLTEGTVKLHVAAILKSLGAINRTQAVTAARMAGLIEDAR
jgi:DNA-binding NarL/FixJ family response regulator